MDFTILIVDDEQSIRESLAELLMSHFGKKCHCLHVGSAEEALQVFQKKKPNLVMTDILLPKMNGIDLTRKLRELKHETPVIVFSGGGEGDAIVKHVLLDAAANYGAISTLPKPFDIHQMLISVERALNFSTK